MRFFVFRISIMHIIRRHKFDPRFPGHFQKLLIYKTLIRQTVILQF